MVARRPCFGVKDHPFSGVGERALLIRLRDGYVKSAGLIPVTRTAEVKDGVLDLEYTLGASNVLFLEIK